MAETATLRADYVLARKVHFQQSVYEQVNSGRRLLQRASFEHGYSLLNIRRVC